MPQITPRQLKEKLNMTPEYMLDRMWVNLLKAVLTIAFTVGAIYGFSLLVERPAWAEIALAVFCLLTLVRVCVTVWEW